MSEQLWGHLDLALAGLVPGVLFGPGVSIPVSHQRICNISGSKPLSIFPGLDGAEWKGGWTWSAHVLANTAQNCSHSVASIHSPKDSSVFFTEEGN